MSKPKKKVMKIKKKQLKKIEATVEDSEDFPLLGVEKLSHQALCDQVWRTQIQQDFPTPVTMKGAAMDSLTPLLPFGGTAFNTAVPESLLQWYGSQGFIGYQMCAFLQQQWMINKACTVPAQDAVRKGYEITINNGEEIDTKIQNEIKNTLDKEFQIMPNLIEFIRMGRVFGVRIALFLVDSPDPEYYEKPFNIDGVGPYQYKGISQIDPYWITPELGLDAASHPASKYFYEPTWWRVQGQRIHRSHLVIMRHAEVADILKPTYFYGGVSLCQQIYERVYAAERIANEGPMLSLTKRSIIYKTDLSKAVANPGLLQQKLEQQRYLMDNYATRVIDTVDDVVQLDTALADLDAVLMAQSQVVAATAYMPAVKLLGTTPKGFNATGEYEEAVYHEELESIENTHATPLLDRHYLLLIRSHIAPKYGIAPFEVTVKWNPLDAMTAEEEAMLNKLKAETGAILSTSGAITGEDERRRLISDPMSGYNGMDEEIPEDELEQEEEYKPEERIDVVV